MAPALLLLYPLMLGCASRLPPEADWRPQAEDCDLWRDRDLTRRLDRRTRSHARDGNRVELLVDGVSAWRRRLEISAGADLILVKTYIWADDEVGRATARFLSHRAREGAHVVVQYDIKGSSDTAAMLSLWDASRKDGALPQPPLFKEMAAAGVQVVPVNVPRSRRQIRKLLTAEDEGSRQRRVRFRSLTHWDHFDHEKYWITGHRQEDGGLRLQAILGGLNVASEYAWGGTDAVDPVTGRGGWRDTDVLLEGPVVLDVLQRFFDALDLNGADAAREQRDWERPQPVAGAARVRFVWSQPRLGGARHVERLYRGLIRAMPERAELRLETAYFAPGPRLRHTLEGAMRAERRLTLITNSQATLDVPLVGDASRAAFTRIRQASGAAELYEWRTAPGHATLHTKAASFGACGPVVVGSANLDGLSTVRNSEGVVVIEDPELRLAFDAMFEADLVRSDRVTLEELGEGSWLLKLYQGAVYRLAWSWLAVEGPLGPGPVREAFPP
jgi:cardiolipin synthase